ncbi:hypothetical protein HYFRA_00009906 [Hymenoscyphus fraxineus]|uniref:ATP-dependent DNA helicase II subunit 1 n=1 Tax=Hymenoscyphus fraxineus TaxID=746836 RepID=A0A9N9L334_9HELO|nr:hypothetical protein HYFRA_00009906 [Hymenoscyphus fraxineus]
MDDSTPSWKKNEEEEEEEELDEANYIMQKDAVLFAIDISSTMLKPPPPSDSKKAEKDSPATAAIKCAYQIMQQRIISSPKDMMGVMLYGTKESKFIEEDGSVREGLYPHCYLLSDLNIPSAEDVKTLKAIVKEEEEAKDLLVPAEKPVAMSNLLFCANQIFTTRAPNFGSRRLFIITDNDDPHSDDKEARSQAAVRAKDLYDLGVVIELFPISHPEHDFDRSKFYDDIIYSDATDGNELTLGPTTFKAASEDGISLLNSLITDINSKQFAKRTLFSNLPFEIGPGLTISVKGYNLLQQQKPARSCYVYMDGETPQIVVGHSTKNEEESARPIEKVEIKKAYKFGGSQVFFTADEQKELKNFGSPVLRIIGFKPQSMLEFGHSVKKSTFIYPSEEDYIGSTRVFSALWKKLLDDKKMGVAWYIARKNATPILVAILPSPERMDESSGAQVIPAGLWLYPLPFADDLRHAPDLPKPTMAPDNLVDEMRLAIQQLQLPKGIYDPSRYPNPSLQWHYRILQAMALDEEIPAVPEDKTVPKYKQINKRAGEHIHNWGVLLGGVPVARGVKREGEDENGPNKKSKLKSESLEGMTLAEIKRVVEGERLKSHSVAQLRAFLESKGLAKNGNKGDLLERVEQWVESQ